MNLIDFKLYFREAKVEKARVSYEVIGLRKAAIRWLASVSPGMYKVQIELSGIRIDWHSCTCDSRSHTGFCEHTLAVLFALRRHLTVNPLPVHSARRILIYDKELTDTLKDLRDEDMALSLRDAKKFTKVCDQMLDQIPRALEDKQYENAVGMALGAYRTLHLMQEYIDSTPEEGWEVLAKSMKWLTDLPGVDMPSEIKDNLFHDMCLESIKGFLPWPDELEETNPLDILLSYSNSKEKADKFLKVLDTLAEITAAETDSPSSYLSALDVYREKIGR